MIRGDQQTLPNDSQLPNRMEINASLASSIYRHSLNTPDAPAVVCRGQTLTYGDFAGKAAQISASLRSSESWQQSAGHPPRVGILASRGIDACVAVMGACWAGVRNIWSGCESPGMGQVGNVTGCFKRRFNWTTEIYPHPPSISHC